MAELPIVAPGYEETGPEEEDLRGVLTNTCVIDRAVLTEALDAAMRTPFLRILRIVEPLLMLLCLGLLIWALTDRQTSYAVFCGFLLVMIAYFYLQQFILYPKKAVKNQLTRQALEDGAAELENRLYFREENIANRRGEGDQLLHMGYDKVKRVTETRQLIVITTRRNRLVPLDKQGFENGTAETFWRLMERKAPGAKRLRL